MGCGQQRKGEMRRPDLILSGIEVGDSQCQHTDTDTSTTKTDGCGTHTKVLGDLDKSVGHLRGVCTSASELGRVEDDGAALHGVEGSVLLWHSCRRSASCLMTSVSKSDGELQADSLLSLQWSLPEKARVTLAAWKAGRATLKELWAAIEAIFGAAILNEEAIGDDMKLEG